MYQIRTNYNKENHSVYLFGKRISLAGKTVSELSKIENKFKLKQTEKSLHLVNLRTRLQKTKNQNVIAENLQDTSGLEAKIASFEKEINNFDFCIIQIQKQKAIMSETVVLVKKTNRTEKLTFDNLSDSRIHTMISSGNYEFENINHYKNYLIERLQKEKKRSA